MTATPRLMLMLLVIAVTVAGAFAAVDTSQWEFTTMAGFLDGVSGRIMMRPDAQSDYGGVCMTGFSLDDARAMCRQLGVPVPEDAGEVRYIAPLSPGARMYLGNLSCPPGNNVNITHGCTFNFSASGQACSPSDGAGIDCIRGTPSPTFSPPYTFYAVFQPNAQNLTDETLSYEVKKQIAIFYSAQDDKIIHRVMIQQVTEYNTTDGERRFNVTFQIGDRQNDNGIPKREIEETLIRNAHIIFGTNVGLVSITSTAPPLPPANTHDQTGWKWRLAGGSKPGQGRIEVDTNIGVYGTVCGVGFSAAEAFAVCGSLGFVNPPNAIAFPFFGGGTGLIALSDVICDSGQLTLNDCSFSVWTPNRTTTQCTHINDAGVDCAFETTLRPTGVPVTYSPDYFLPAIAWTGTIAIEDYDKEILLRSLSNSLDIDYSRIQFLGERRDDLYVYASWVFLNGAPDEPAAPYNEALEQYEEIGLIIEFSIQELTNNLTATGPPTTALRWNVSLSDGSRGLVLVTPSTGGAAGTVCSVDFGRDAAAAVCRSAGIVAGDSAVLAGFTPTISGEIYLDQVSCSAGQVIDSCVKRVSLPGNKLTPCTHAQDVGVICYNRTLVAPPNPNSNVSLFVAYFQGSRVDFPVIARTLKAFIPFNETRLVLTDAYFEQGTGVTQISFFVQDAGPSHAAGGTAGASEPPRSVLEYWLQHASSQELNRSFGIFRLDWTYGKPVLPPGPTTHDLSGWKFKLDTGGTKGLLLALPPGQTQWGGVCGLHFWIDEAIAACRTLGFDTDFALPYTYGQDNPIVLSAVDCPLPQTNATLSQCNSTVWSGSNQNLDCPRIHAVTVDCLPREDLAPMEFTAVVKSQGFSNTGFSTMIASSCNITASRVQINGAAVSDGTYTFVKFEFINDATVTRATTMVDALRAVQRPFQALAAADPPPPTPDPNDPSEPDEPGGSFGFGFGSLDGVYPLYGFPRSAFEFLMWTYATPTILYEGWGIYELRSNVTVPNGAITPNKATWRLQLVNFINTTAGMQSRYGRLELQMGEPNAPWGTVSCRNFTHSDALVACRQITGNPSLNYALAVPFFSLTGKGIIYLSGVKCPATATNFINGCTYNASTRYVKLNNATHDEDVGLICGRNVVNDPGVPIQYQLGFDPQREPINSVSRVVNTLAELTGIPASRVIATRYYDEPRLLVIVSFSFGKQTSPLEPSPGDLDLFTQSINAWGLWHLFGAVHFETSVSIVPDFPSPGAPTPAPPTASPQPSGGTTTTTKAPATTTTTTTKAPVASSTTTTTKAPATSTTTKAPATSTTVTTQAPSTSTTSTPPPVVTSTTTTGAPASTSTTSTPAPQTTSTGATTATPPPPVTSTTSTSISASSTSGSSTMLTTTAAAPSSTTAVAPPSGSTTNAATTGATTKAPQTTATPTQTPSPAATTTPTASTTASPAAATTGTASTAAPSTTAPTTQTSTASSQAAGTTTTTTNSSTRTAAPATTTAATSTTRQGATTSTAAASVTTSTGATETTTATMPATATVTTPPPPTGTSSGSSSSAAPTDTPTSPTGTATDVAGSTTTTVSPPSSTAVITSTPAPTTTSPRYIATVTIDSSMTPQQVANRIASVLNATQPGEVEVVPGSIRYVDGRQVADIVFASAEDRQRALQLANTASGRDYLGISAMSAASDGGPGGAPAEEPKSMTMYYAIAGAGGALLIAVVIGVIVAKSRATKAKYHDEYVQMTERNQSAQWRPV